MSQPESEFTRTNGMSGSSAAVRSLPPYSRSLLRISVPVMVTLATTRLSLTRILQLGVGSIVPLEKSCEDPLTLQIGNLNLAVGEAVKIGDKFGLRISSMVMPEEKFLAIRGKREKA
jgi:flagellar motor switch protein FliN